MTKFIGILCWSDIIDGKKYQSINTAFSEMIEKAGATPIIFPQIAEMIKVDHFLDLVDGVLLIGGSDISPHLYGEDPTRYIWDTNPRRDVVEMNFLQRAIERKVPIFAVCRGMQLLNVYLGGDLYQDIYEQKEKVMNHSDRDNRKITYYHNISIEKDSHMEKIFGSKTLVNSYHHQAIRKLAGDLKATARANDGIIEAVEYKNEDQFILGVQFHPEVPEDNPKFQEIYKYFVSQL